MGKIQTTSNDSWIIHCDINGHFAYSSLIYYPQLLDVPVVIGGNEEARHGIVLSKNRLAKQYKIKTGTALYQARKLCPELKALPPIYPLYERTSMDFYNFLDTYSPISAPFGCDGKSIDVTNTAHLYGGGVHSVKGVEAIVRELHECFPKQYGLDLSIGISWNLSFAKLACDVAGANGIKWITRKSPEDTDWKSQVHAMPVENLLYVGSATKRKLNSYGIYTLGEMVKCGPELLEKWLGKLGLAHYIRACGKDTSRLIDEDGGPPMRSIGNGSTTPYDMMTEEQVHVMAHVLSSSVCRRMRAHKVAPRTVEVSVTYAMDGDLKYETYQCAMPIPSNLDVEFATAALSLFHKKFNMKYPIRKLGLRGKDLMFNTSVYQLSFELEAMRRDRAMVLADCVDEINNRWKHAVRRCVELADPALSGLGCKPNQEFAPAGWY
jgi:DNA polymerase-4